MAVVPLSKSKHSELKLGAVDLKEFISLTSLPVYINEVRHLACDYPLFFNSSEGSCQLRLLCSIDSASGSAWINSEGKWIGSYVPAFLRHQPFSAHAIDGSENVVIFLNENSERLKDDGSPLFENSEPTELLNKIISTMEQIHVVGRTTQLALDCISALNIIKPWETRIQSANSKQIALEGLECIDEEAINDLTASQLSELKDASALTLIYGQLLSMRNLDKLIFFQNQGYGSSKGSELGFSLNTSGDQIAFETGSTEETLNFDKI